ncbi:MAG: VWA domain-containing protein [Pseudorhodobacter sp.]|nr:VWA domain-containing protein [Pseudorhodobacter sp.]
MTDDFDALKAALKASPPPEPDARAAALRLAMENFDRLQGSTDRSRLSQDRPTEAGFLNGVRRMLKALNTKTALAATTSAAAICLGLFVVWPQLQHGLPDLPKPKLTVQEIAPPAPPAQTAPAAPTPVAPAPSAESTAPDAAAQMAAPLAQGRLRGVVANGAMAAKSAPGMMTDQVLPPEPDTEAFNTAPTNPVHVTTEEPVSTFSVDVDTASYAVVRSSLNNGQLPPPEAVRIEEMVNYFPYDYPAPAAGGAPFTDTVTVMPTPWNPKTRLVHIALQGRLPAIEDRPTLNLVFLIDTSGSMDEPNKLPLLKQSLSLMLGKLRPQDRVAMVAYAGSAGVVLPPTAASDKQAILAALDNLSAGGSTAGAEGLALAYDIAAKMKTDGAVSRVLLATDGDFNVGIDDPEQLKTFIAKERDGGTYLSVLGFGRGNLDDATMQALAQNGNGTASYIDTLSEVQKVLVDQLTGALFPIADDVKIQVEWNPARVAEYRLIGYETRALRREDFNNDRVDAGEIGAGLQVTALYEVTAPGSPALLNDALRYGKAPQVGGSPELGFLRLRYKNPGQTASNLIETPITPASQPTDDARFAAAIAGFGQLLQHSTYIGSWGYDQAIALASGAKGADPYGYRAEAVTLMRLAQSLTQN